MPAFFEFAVIGPIAGPRFGLADGCIGCTQRNGAPMGECRGFGPGCLGARRQEPRDERADDQDASARITA